MKTMLAALAALTSGLARAHEGHGPESLNHWRATDTLALLLVVAGAAGVWLWLRRK